MLGGEGVRRREGGGLGGERSRWGGGRGVMKGAGIESEMRRKCFSRVRCEVLSRARLVIGCGRWQGGGERGATWVGQGHGACWVAGVLKSW